jgi:hypothetical protein
VSALQNGWMTVNEIRELENLNPIGPEGDKHFVQLNMTTLDKVGEDQAVEPMPPAEAEQSPVDDAEDQTEEDATDGN